MTKHTPGPWDNIQYIYDMHIVATNPDKSEICIAEMQAGNMADAHLIAAAPDLLEALEELLKAIYYDGEDGTDRLHHAEIDARAAIAKATGEDK